MADIAEPGTIDDLVADAVSAGHQVTPRLIRDWTEAGLLDYPERRPSGKGHGSRQALYPAAQRNLLLTLLHHRVSNGIKSLARIPVGIWMYWGDAYVPLRQVRIAMNTWVGDPRVSQRSAKETAREVLRQLDNPRATVAARRQLLSTLTDIAYTGRADLAQLEHAVRKVFEPDAHTIRRVVGHTAAPLMAESMVDLVRARLTAIGRLAAGQVTDADFNQARHAHLIAYAEYALQQPVLAAYAQRQNPGMYEPVTAESALNSCCGHLLTAIGMAAMHPGRAAELSAAPAPRIQFR